MNWDVAGIVIGNLVVICLFMITFHLLDRRNIEKDRNQREIAILTLKSTCEECKAMVEMFDNPKILSSVLSKIDHNIPMAEDKCRQYYLNRPFKYREKIEEFTISGIITKDEYSGFIDVEKKYTIYINAKISLNDYADIINLYKDQFLRHLIKS